MTLIRGQGNLTHGLSIQEEQLVQPVEAGGGLHLCTWNNEQEDDGIDDDNYDDVTGDNYDPGRASF